MKNRDTFRHKVLTDLASKESLIRMNDENDYADDMHQSILDNPAFVLDSRVMDLISSFAMKMSRQDYFDMIPNVRLPFDSQWIEYRLEGEGGEDPILVGGMVDRIADGVRVRTATGIDSKKHKIRPVLHAETEILFRPDGHVIATGTPMASFYNIISESTEDAGQSQGHGIGSLEERRSDDLDTALRLAGTMAILAALMERPGTVKVASEAKVFPIDEKKSSRKEGDRVRYGVKKVKLGELGKRHLSTPDVAAKGSKAKRAAHWVRGHMFLARNNKLTYRSPHVRGGDKPKETIRAIVSPEATESEAPSTDI